MFSCATKAGVSLLAASVFAWPALGQGDPCVVPDNGGGTVTLPPDGCPYLSPDEFHMIVEGLPKGTEIIIEPIHRDFICKKKGVPQEFCNSPGGILGGEVEQFNSQLEFHMTGTGDLEGFERTIVIQNVFCEVHTGPRNPGDPVQVFPNEMVILQGNLFGDPDFDFLEVRAGLFFGLPSPGQTTLTRLGPPGSDFQVDSFFDVFYEIEFVGATGSVLQGAAGTTSGVVHMESQGGGGGSPCSPPLTCPPGATQEGEPCGTDTNGGANSTPPVFDFIDCGQTICGTSWAEGGIRDTDWYCITGLAVECKILNVSVISEFPVCVFLVVIDDDGNAIVIEVGYATICIVERILDILVLNIETFYLVVAPGTPDGGIFDGIPCGSGQNDYQITLDCIGQPPDACAGCELTCPPGATPEGEPCGGDVNGGCNSTPPAFGSISCGETVCGEAWADGGTRDTDWYLFSLFDDCTIVTAQLTSEFPGVSFIVDGIPACAPVVVATSNSADCLPGTLAVAPLGPGDYVIFAATADFTGTPCGTTNDYFVSVDCQPCPEPPKNDDCPDAIQIFDGDTDYTTLLATTDGPQPCGQIGSDIWFIYDPTCTGTATITTCNNATYDTALAAYVYTGDCADLVNLACNDDFAGCGLTSTITVNVACGQPILLQVGGFAGGQGDGTVTITCAGDPCVIDIPSGEVYLELGAGFPDETFNPNDLFNPPGPGNPGWLPEGDTLEWHELYPNYCQSWTMQRKPGDAGGVIAPCQRVIMQKEDNPPNNYHIDDVTITIWIRKQQPGAPELALDLAPNLPTLGFDEIQNAMENPLASLSQWHEVFPNFCKIYNTQNWDDGGDPGLSAGDQICLQNKSSGNINWYDIVGVTIDIIISKNPPSCFGDTNGDNVVNVDDLVNVILDWGTNGAANGGDVNGSGFVDVDDLVDVILNWGPCT